MTMGETPCIEDPEFERADTEPDGLRPQRDTLPPEADDDPIADPEHQKLVAQWEEALDERFAQMREHFADLLRAELKKQLAPIVDDVADNHETKRQLRATQAELEAVKARCPHCSVPPAGQRRVSAPR